MNVTRSASFFLIITCLFLPSCNRDKWEGQIYVEQGVTIVENNGSGLWGIPIEDKVELIEELALGVEQGEDHLMFYNLRNIVVDGQSNIYILDGGNHRLLKFDRNGEFIWSSGRKGQGPGEFEDPGRVYLSVEDNPAVQDSTSIQYFNPQGQFERSINIGKSFRNVAFLPDGRLFVNIFLRGRPGVAAEYYSNTGEFLGEFPALYRYGPEMSPNLGASVGGGDFQWRKDKVYLSLPDVYEIREYDLDGNILRKTLRNVKFQPPNIIVRTDGRGVSVRPSDSNGPCFVYKEEYLINCIRLVEKKSETDFVSERFLDFFNERGQFLGSMKLPAGYTLSTIDSEWKLYLIQWDPFPKIIRAALDFK